MKVSLSESRTLDGFTYVEGDHEVDELVGVKLLSTFPVVCKVWQPPKPKKAVVKKEPAEKAPAKKVEAKAAPAKKAPAKKTTTTRRRRTTKKTG